MKQTKKGFGGFSSECQATRFCRGFFYSVVHSLLVCFRCCFSLEQMSENNQTDPSPIEAFHVEKSPKKWTKVIAEESFPDVQCLWRILFFFARAAKKCPKNMSA